MCVCVRVSSCSINPATSILEHCSNPKKTPDCHCSDDIGGGGHIHTPCSDPMFTGLLLPRSTHCDAGLAGTCFKRMISVGAVVRWLLYDTVLSGLVITLSKTSQGSCNFACNMM